MTKFGELKFGEMKTVGEMPFGEMTFGDLTFGEGAFSEPTGHPHGEPQTSNGFNCLSSGMYPMKCSYEPESA